MALQIGLNKGLPLCGAGLAVHPEPNRKQNHGCKQRCKTFGKFALRTTDIDKGVGGKPGRSTQHEGTGYTRV